MLASVAVTALVDAVAVGVAVLPVAPAKATAIAIAASATALGRTDQACRGRWNPTLDYSLGFSRLRHS